MPNASDREYYISLAMESMGTNEASKLSENELVFIGRDIETEILKKYKHILKAS